MEKNLLLFFCLIFSFSAEKAEIDKEQEITPPVTENDIKYDDEPVERNLELKMSGMKGKKKRRLNSKVFSVFKKLNYGKQCDLAIEIFPMYYIPIIRQSSFRVILNSNCMKRKEILFEAFYHEDRRINWNYHPTIFTIDLLGNFVKIEFKEPEVIDRYDVMKSLMYKIAQVTMNKKKLNEIEVIYQNQVILEPQYEGGFNPYNINILKNITKPVQCYKQYKKVRGWKLLKALKLQKEALTKQMANKSSRELQQLSVADKKLQALKKQKAKLERIQSERLERFKEKEKIKLHMRKKEYIDRIEAVCFV